MTDATPVALAVGYPCVRVTRTGPPALRTYGDWKMPSNHTEPTFREVMEAARRAAQYADLLKGRCSLRYETVEAAVFSLALFEGLEGDPHLARAVDRMEEAVETLNAALADNPDVRANLHGNRLTFSFNVA